MSGARTGAWRTTLGWRLVLGTPLYLVTLLFLLPILWMIATSFQSADLMFQQTDSVLSWIPTVLHPENYPDALAGAPFLRYFINSGIVSAAAMTGNLVFGVLAGYGLAKFRFPGDRIVLIAILATLMLPLEVTLVPTFLVVHALGWLNTYQGIAGPLLIDAFGVFLMRQSMLAVPRDYAEAARLDGAGELRILWSIMLPQCRPALAVLAIFAFRDSWDQFLWPLTVVSVDSLRTYPLGLAQFGDDFGNPPTQQMAIAVLATIPVFLLFAVLQRSLRRAFGLSGIKG